MKLEDIGFLEIIEHRAANITPGHISYCEWIITARCNFDCPYCNKFSGELANDLSTEEAKRFVDVLQQYHTKYLHITGGEPTVRKDLPEIIQYAKSKGMRIGLSTNGSRSLEYYTSLVKSGVELFSISLDVHKEELNKQFTTVDNVFDRVVNNIRCLSQMCYVTAGVVFNDANIESYNDILNFISGLGVHDIRIMTSTHYNKVVALDVSPDLLEKHPILRYRVKNFNDGKNMRGSELGNSHKCWLVIDDVSIVQNYHFPCAVYAREGGKPIGIVSNTMHIERANWFDLHDSHKDPICKKYCMDFKCRFNERVEDIRG